MTRPARTGRARRARAPRKRQTRWTSERARKFLDFLRRGNAVGHAARLAGVARATVYEYREQDPEFATAWDAALEEGTDVLEQEAFRRAVHGTVKPLVSRGQIVVGHYKGGRLVTPDTIGAKIAPVLIHEYSDRLLDMLLRARRPEQYRDNVHVVGRMQHSGTVIAIGGSEAEYLAALRRARGEADAADAT